MDKEQIEWIAGDRLEVRPHTSKPGYGLAYGPMDVDALDPGTAGGWDVYDGIYLDAPDQGTEVSFYGFSVVKVLKRVSAEHSARPALWKALRRDVGIGIVIPTEAQVESLWRLTERSGENPEDVAKRARYDLIGWRPGQDAPIMMGFCGMIVGIEPDGEAHS